MNQAGLNTPRVYAGRRLSLPAGLTGDLLPVADGDGEPWTSVHLASPHAPEPGAHVHTWVEADGSVTLELARTRSGLVLRVPGEADFALSADGRRVMVHPHAPEVDEPTLSHLLLDQVLPRLLAHQGALVLHAAAVDTRGGAVLLVGRSGSGKSTLAAALAGTGLAVLADDAVVLREEGDGLVAVPTYPGLRLQADSVERVGNGAGPARPMARYSAKVRIPSPYAQRPHTPLNEDPWAARPVAAAFLLDPPDGPPEGGDVSVSRLLPADACMLFIRDSFQLDVTDRMRQARQFDQAATAGVRIPVHAVTYPRAYTALPQVCRAVLQAAGAGL